MEDFEIIGSIRDIETIASGTGVRDRPHLWRRFGRDHWRKMKGIAEVRYPDRSVWLGRATLVRSARHRKTAAKSKAAAVPAVNGRRPKFVICVDPGEYAEVDLDLGKVYEALPTEKDAREHGMIRVVDNSGEDYLFPAKRFVDVKLPKAAREAVLRAR